MTQPVYRNKTYAHPSATYAEFVVSNEAREERLLYRVYLGANTTTDFNLVENTNYHWKVRINSADYAHDFRIQYQSLKAVVSTNLVATSNCVMLLPGGNLCFNPYKHEAGEGGWNTWLAPGGVIQPDKTIDHVRVLWQTKDAGTSGDLVLLYQWGRKDPFFNSLDGTNNEKDVIYDGYGLPVNVDKVPMNRNVGDKMAYSVAHPLSFYYESGQTDWYTSADGRWNAPGADNKAPGRKGLHDPCPYGWKVPMMCD